MLNNQHHVVFGKKCKNLLWKILNGACNSTTWIRRDDL